MSDPIPFEVQKAILDRPAEPAEAVAKALGLRPEVVTAIRVKADLRVPDVELDVGFQQVLLRVEGLLKLSPADCQAIAARLQRAAAASRTKSRSFELRLNPKIAARLRAGEHQEIRRQFIEGSSMREIAEALALDEVEVQAAVLGFEDSNQSNGAGAEWCLGRAQDATQARIGHETKAVAVRTSEEPS